MAEKADSRLKYLQQKKKRELEALDSEGNFGLEVERVERRIEPKVKVLVQYGGDPQQLADAGLEVRTVAGDIISGLIHVENLTDLAAIDDVVRIESSRPMVRELDISLSEINANQVHVGPPGHRGSGVIIGIIDTGIDITHSSFRQEDGLTRILSIWDQPLLPQGSESSPAGFTYGVEYSEADINAALSAADPTTVVRHVDSRRSGHGTHVAGIAAGDGSEAGNGQPANTFVGVAPEANLIVVKNLVTTQAFGDSSQTLDAVSYIFRKAAALDMPVVINLSQGDNIGPHDGTSLLERGIDNLLGEPGNIMVKSAGNEGSRNRHAMGTVAAGASEEIGLTARSPDRFENTIDIWYAGADRFGFTLTPPSGGATATINPGETRSINLGNGNAIFVDSTINEPNNNDNRIYVAVTSGTKDTIEQGEWTITLKGQTVVDGQFHAWIERSNDQTFQFRRSHQSRSHTISIPGTSREIISVGSYITKGAGVGNLSSFSSRGPTRDGRPKPEIAAPGQRIMAARAQNTTGGSGVYQSISGTSMAAPHVAGVIALMLEKNDTLTQQEVRDCLLNNARGDIFTGAVPNNDWGAGKVDALAAVNCVQVQSPFKFIDDPGTLKFLDDLGSLKFSDDTGTINKFADDGGGTPNKFADDIGTGNKLVDDGGTPNKFVDDGGTINKFADDSGGTPNKFADDIGTSNKFVDDGGGTPNKFVDDGTSPNKALDDLKLPALDKNPNADNIGFKLPANDRAGNPQPNPFSGGQGEGEAAPFIMSTPHHSTAWMQNYPSAYQQELVRYQQMLQAYESALMQYKTEIEGGRLSPETHAQVAQLDQAYRKMLDEYQQLLKAAGLA